MYANNNRKYFIFLVIIVLMGFICGIFFLNNIDESTKEIVLNNINNWVLNLSNIHINNILSHLLLLALFLVISSFIIGLPLFIFYIFFNGFSLGFIISSLSSIFGFKGCLYGIVYVLITKGLFSILLLCLGLFLIRIGEKVFFKIIGREKTIDVNKQIGAIIKKYIIVLLIIFINDLFLFFLGGRILNIFNFLLI